ncbi:TLC domain-containing protein [Phascolomyces articulosus]|uniref:TLC domain-containing protein n=1 Tax=Phascolomyces articulosus TaxID=60185 RepID=A0AAD5PJZ9_9FUNG|nr:TLC domain-containing protein [Phascolomyces articulosus]
MTPRAVPEVMMKQTPKGKFVKPVKKQQWNRKMFIDYLVKHQIEAPLRVIAIIVAGYFLGLPLCDKFLFIANQGDNGLYHKSFYDITFLLFYICVFTALRAAIMNHVLIPLARWSGVKKKKFERFAEQGYSFIYYSISSACGLYVMYHSPWWDDTSYYWRDYPVTEYDKSFKYYYLVQFAFWLQQIFVLEIEEPRKDYRELVLHHINTLLLVSLSYCCNFTRVGNAVFVYMDLPDAILALAKLLNYSVPGIICNTTFAIMIVAWMYTRVYLYGGIIWSTATEPDLYVKVFKLAPLEGHWFPYFVKYIILGLMIGLYCLILFWTAMIFKVLIRLVTTTDGKDVRSDDEDEGEEDEKPSAPVTASR